MVSIILVSLNKQLGHVQLACAVDETKLWLACEQAKSRSALTAEQEKEEDLESTSLKFEYLHRKSRCWLAEMTLVLKSLPLTLFFNVCLHSRSFPLPDDWQKSDSSVDWEPQVNWRWNLICRDVVLSSPSFSRPAARAPRRAWSQAKPWFRPSSLGPQLSTRHGLLVEKAPNRLKGKLKRTSGNSLSPWAGVREQGSRRCTTQS